MKNNVLIILTPLLIILSLLLVKNAQSAEREITTTKVEKTKPGAYTAFTLSSVGSNFPNSDSEFFYVDLDVDTYKNNAETVPYYEISTTEEYGDSILRNSPSNCEIEYIPSENGEKRYSIEPMICLLDIPESELTAKNLHIVYNFPKEMCEYTSVALPWHFNFPVWPGPVVRECPVKLDNGRQTNLTCDLNGRSCAIAISTGRCLPEGFLNINELCYSASNAPKCCYGGDKGNGEIWKPEAGCFGGPGTIATQFGDFYPGYVTALQDGGLKQTITLPSLLSFNEAGYDTTATYANYLKRLDLPFEDLGALRRSSLPVFLQNSYNYTFSPRLFFEFSCLDNTREPLHQILLMIREWNTFEEFSAFYSSGGVDEGDPDIKGKEGKHCDYEQGSLKMYECNDKMDFEDFGSDYPRIRYKTL